MNFSYTPNATDWARLAPELVIGAAALLVLLVDLVLPARRRAWLAAVALLGVIGSAVAVGLLLAAGNNGAAFYYMITSDSAALLSDAIVLLAAGLAILLSPEYLRRQAIAHQAEYYALLLLATVGMLLMASATNLMTIFVGLELLSLGLYILSAYVANRFSSQEAGMKYFLLSSFASGFLLYGMALTYGATGATSLVGIRAFLDHHAFSVTGGYGPLLLAGLSLMAVGFCFKVSGVPFHTWTPDVYVGAPTTITAFMSVGTKVAAFVALARVFLFALAPLFTFWQPIFWSVAILSMIAGNLLAVTQTDVKRMLAYSSVAHAGYIMIGIATGTILGFSSVLVYLATYAAMNLGAFGVVAILERRDGQGTQLSDYNGLARRQPVLAAVLLICLLSLAGFPPLAGFAGKYSVFFAAYVGGHLELTIIGAVTSMIGLFYYLRIIWAMYFVQSGMVSAPASPAPAASATMAAPALAAPALAAVGANSGGSSGPAGPAERGVASGRATAARATEPASAAVRTAARAAAPGIAAASGLALGIAAALTVVVGILPGPLFQFALQAAAAALR
jgi:NADH-quinone oxidoreductase subunit N